VTSANATVTGKTKRDDGLTVRAADDERVQATTNDHPACRRRLRQAPGSPAGSTKGPAAFRARVSARADGQAVFASQWTDAMRST
jgi:hypothetical protein